MSHSLGAIRFNDGTIRYYEYNGTSDYPISHHYKTSKEVFDNWRNHDFLECTCGNEESVMIYTSYGKGYYFEGFSCKNCFSIKSEVYFDIIEYFELEHHWAKELSEFKDDDFLY